MSKEYEDCLKRKYKKPFYEKCKEMGLKVNKNMSIEELCELYYKKEDSSFSSTSFDYENETATNLIKLCRERGIKLKSYNKKFLIQKLKEYEEKESSVSSKKQDSPKNQSTQKNQDSSVSSKKQSTHKNQGSSVSSKKQSTQKNKDSPKNKSTPSSYELYRENKYNELADYNYNFNIY
jgi:hypothetical protein